MRHQLDIRFFAHSWVSDWNHGNAHFLRGLVRSLVLMGHRVRCYEQAGAWSLTNLVRQETELCTPAIEAFRRAYPELDVRFYDDAPGLPERLEHELRGADVVVVHEWNSPCVVNAILDAKTRLGFAALFHDTHHRAYTSPAEILRFRLEAFDGVLAFGEGIRRIYTEAFHVPRTWTFHEAADLETFFPREERRDADVLWIGNWGDEERTRELCEFLVRPAMALAHRRFVAHGVRYPDSARELLGKAGIEFRGYLPNLLAPLAYSRSALALHVPRRQYANGLSGIPTIRVFEALACGRPLLCSPWSDAEQLFRPGQDYLVAEDGAAMRAAIEDLLRDDAARRQLAANGLETVRSRHTCAHRAAQFLQICGELGK